MIDLKYFITTESILDDFDTVDVAADNVFDLLKIDELNRHIYDQEVWTGNSVPRGEDGLLLLYNRFTTYSLKAKRDGSAFAEREAKHYKSELLNKIKYLKSELGI